jgi:hypothetical protein
VIKLAKSKHLVRYPGKDEHVDAGHQVHWIVSSMLLLVSIFGCGKSDPPPTLSTAADPRLTLQSWKVDGNEVSETPWEIDRGKTQQVTVDVKAGTWGLSQVMRFEFIPNDHYQKPPKSKSRKPYPVVKGDPVLNFMLMVYRGKKIDSSNVAQMLMGSFEPGDRPDKGSLIYFVKIDEPGEYLMQFTVSDSSRENPSGGYETVPLREQALIVR